jgi:hypothetical protein
MPTKRNCPSITSDKKTIIKQNTERIAQCFYLNNDDTRNDMAPINANMMARIAPKASGILIRKSNIPATSITSDKKTRMILPPGNF